MDDAPTCTPGTLGPDDAAAAAARLESARRALLRLRAGLHTARTAPVADGHAVWLQVAELESLTAQLHLEEVADLLDAARSA